MKSTPDESGLNLNTPQMYVKLLQVYPRTRLNSWIVQWSTCMQVWCKLSHVIDIFASPENDVDQIESVCMIHVLLPIDKMIDQGFLIKFAHGPLRARYYNKAWGPNTSCFSMLCCMFYSFPMAKWLFSAGRIWPAGHHLRTPAIDQVDLLQVLGHPSLKIPQVNILKLF